jgi:hypothetical protein
MTADPKTNINETPEFVGYKRPPKSQRFQPGKSGNYKGRPKGSKNTYTLLNKIANEEVKIVQQNGKIMKMTKKAVALMKAVNAACTGDMKTLALLLPHWIQGDAKAEEQSAKEKAMSQTDQDIIKEFMNRNTETKGE